MTFWLFFLIQNDFKDTPVIQAFRHGLRVNPSFGERFDQSALFFGSVI